MKPQDIRSLPDVERWLRHYVEWNDETSRDRALQAIKVIRDEISDQGGAVEAVQKAHNQTWAELAKTKAKLDHEFNRANRLEKQVLEREQRIADLERAVVAFAAEKALKSTGS